MDKELNKTVPYFVVEGEMARMERVNHRLWILCILLLAILLATNAGWLYYESPWEYVDVNESYELNTGDNGNAIYNGSGDVRIYGDSESDEAYEIPPKKNGW